MTEDEKLQEKADASHQEYLDAERALGLGLVVETMPPAAPSLVVGKVIPATGGLARTDKKEWPGGSDPLCSGYIHNDPVFPPAPEPSEPIPAVAEILGEMKEDQEDNALDRKAQERIKDAIAKIAYEEWEREVLEEKRKLGMEAAWAKLKPSLKDTNPKDAVGTQKWRQYCTVPTTIIWELGVAMLEGARKYGRHNYRISGVRASVYVDAAKGHIDQWWEGEDIDDESQLNHITKAMASLAVLRDAMICETWVDDRPPKAPLAKLRADLQSAVDSIFKRIPVAKDAFLEGDQYNDENS